QVDVARVELPPIEARRARHVVDEIARVAACAAAVERSDLAAVGRLMNESHASCRDLYEVSTGHLDVLQAAAAGHDAVFGARMVGAGFGGSVLALVRRGAEHAVSAAVASRYEREFGFAPEPLVLEPTGAPGELPDDHC